MEIVGNYKTIQITITEFVQLIPGSVWDKIEDGLLKKFNTEYCESYKNIDFSDSEGHLDSGVSD
jgi:hypothetical protein